MIRITGIKMPLDYTDEQLRKTVGQTLHVSFDTIRQMQLTKRAVDARKKENIVFDITVDVLLDGDEGRVVSGVKSNRVTVYQPTSFTVSRFSHSMRTPPVVVGSGPAGLFAALTLAKAGLQPVLLERGQDVDTRCLDVEAFRRTGVFNPSSHVQFGEGGAGTFSDGKLNTGIHDVRCRFVMEQLAAAGAAEDSPRQILWQAKPHIGTDRLRGIVKELRKEILRLGGQVRFGWQVVDIETEQGRLCALTVQTPDGETTVPCTQMILAVGHSARDTLEMLHERGLPMEQKPFAVGVRIEHPRRMIDESQYGRFAGHPALGAADYKLSCRPIGGRGVYTFCMCPGGEVIAAASEPGRLAINGMSTHARDAANSNSALLVGVLPEDFGGTDPLAGIAFQRQLEQAAFALGGGGYRAPIQLVGDFLRDRPSTDIGEVIPSYAPGVTCTDLRECLPAMVARSLKTALPALGRQLPGFDRPDAVLTGVESRSSSPVRLLRDESGQSALRGVYPCGEGAGYAGGIVSAAVDGVKSAQCLMQQMQAEK